MADRPLIVGAGPTGLSAALFFSHLGVEPRIVGAAEHPASTSNALGVNPRTLDILKGTGVDEAILAEGLPMRRLHIHADGKTLAVIELPLKDLGVEHPMIILPQSRTEQLLEAALKARGIPVERGVALSGVSQDDQSVVATLGSETAYAPVLLAADGAHSAVRHALGLPFPGDAMPQDWRLMDVELEGPAKDEAWIDLREDGPFVALPFNGPTWRLIGFGPPLLDRLPPGWKAGKVAWESHFHVSHRLVPRMAVGRICLAGDAAHIHSPIGARGMNLGIEDAYVFAHCAKAYLDGETGALDAYGASRHRFDAGVVRRVRTLTEGIAALGPMARLARRLIIPLVGAIPPLRAAVLKQGVGLDHPLVIPT